VEKEKKMNEPQFVQEIEQVDEHRRGITTSS